MKINIPLSLAALQVLLVASPASAASPSDDHRAAFAATLADPGDVEKVFAFAEIALREEDFEGAIAALERLVLVDPDLPRVRIQLGGLYLRIGSDAQARAYASSALQSPTLDAQARGEAEALLALADARASRHRLRGVATTALGYQSNANSAPSAQSVTVGGVSYDLAASERAQADGNGFLSAALDYVYDPKLDSGLTLEAIAVGSFTRQLEVTDYDIGTAGLVVGPRLPLTARPEDGANIWIYGLTSLTTLGDDLFSVGFGGGLTLTAPLTTGLWTDVVLEASHVTYHDGSVATSASEQTGFTPRGAVQLRDRLFDHLWVVVGGHGATLRADVASQASVAYGGLVGLAIPFVSPFSSTAPASVDVFYDHTFTRYDEADEDLDPETRRDDTDLRVTALAQMPIGDHLSVFISGGYADHPSNLALYTWSGAFASGGASYVF